MTDILNLAKSALEATVIGKHVYEGFPETFSVYPCASVLERITPGTTDVHELTVNAWTKDDSQVLKDLLRTLTLTGYTLSAVSISDGIPGPDGAGIYVYPVTAQYRVTEPTAAGTQIVYPSLRPMEQEVENVLRAIGGLTVWRIDTDGMSIVSPCVVYEVSEDHPTSWSCNYTAILDLIVDGEPSAHLIAAIVAGMLGLLHARELSSDPPSRDKETGYHIVRLAFLIPRAIGE